MGIDYNKRPSQPAAPQQPPTQQAPAQPGISLQKVTLTKSAPSVSLAKQGSAVGQLRVNLNWTSGAKKGGFFKRSSGIDLDLACLWEFTDGSKGIVQALGNSFQAPREGKPIILLDGDDRSGSGTGGENMYIDLAATQQIRRILIFAYIYEGAPNWAAANGVVTVFPTNGPQIEVRLDEADQSALSCAIALFENRGGELVVNREVRYIRGAQDKVDEAYNWGLNWKAGRK
ncbi:tellurium resistance protein [Gordonia sp. (in: high G+C Gram-positive bacteria)]|jgi:tellurite resistance protein TerA|uniref:TerD family protein n=1 Tax=Gordonia sp. (in: high G+C Gram-positive bacteria) TaxID=84139 RepID=UPI001DB95C69|nr:tellurium resistance protein [Gordonia sp. (in: high G+C Gram-positive bacteria)]MCB1295294.1 tellurium resistance protein [Gordonia sp. (in: high G+C Gram-positive bacteria)]HMS77342.1 tellurium resistance protein [Gordonia sp. (in: high G+C Gram-positive bacteria)]HQV19349.1 tellurium resistance protein [Gordonia sp. (in: high G+C Gram-positive bacteria)]